MDTGARGLNLLLVTFSFPPAGGVGVLRALSLARYLPEFGVQVDVLTAANAPAVGADPTLLKQLPESVRVHRSWTLDLPFAVRKAIKRFVSRPAPKAATGQAAAAANAAASRGGLKQWLGSALRNLLLPDPQVGWLPFALPAAARIIRKRKIDAVLITVPPFSSVLLAARLRKLFPDLVIVVDFRDEWLSTTLNLVSFSKNQRAQEIASQAEAGAVRASTAIVAVTEAAQREIAARYPEDDPAKFRLIYNGYETPPPAERASQAAGAAAAEDRGAQTPSKVVITYLGSVYGSTDPGTLVEAVLGLPAELRSQLHLRFIGHVETEELRADLLRLGDTVELKGFVPRSEALRALNGTDYVLLISHDRINVSAKFYDYLISGKPMVGIIHPAGDVRRLLEETHTGRWADSSDPIAIREMLSEILAGDGLRESWNPDLERIQRFHRRALAGEYAALLNGLVQPPH